MTINRVSVDSAGNQAQRGPLFFSYPSISADGRFVTFSSEASNLVPQGGFIPEPIAKSKSDRHLIKSEALAKKQNIYANFNQISEKSQ
jgi:hypothetical protein